MIKDEALKLALEALEDLGMKHFESTGEMLYKDTFTAIKEALAQPEQEPVAYWNFNSGFSHCMIDQLNEAAKKNPAPLYTTLPQRTWVGLTDKEIDQGLLRSDYAFKTAEAWRAGVVFAMTKLKEKNT